MAFQGSLGVDLQSIIMSGFQPHGSSLQTPRRPPSTGQATSVATSEKGGGVLVASPEPTPPKTDEVEGRGRGRGRNASRGRGRGRGRGGG